MLHRWGVAPNGIQLNHIGPPEPEPFKAEWLDMIWQELELVTYQDGAIRVRADLTFILNINSHYDNGIIQLLSDKDGQVFVGASFLERSLHGEAADNWNLLKSRLHLAALKDGRRWKFGFKGFHPDTGLLPQLLHHPNAEDSHYWAFASEDHLRLCGGTPRKGILVD